VGIGIRKTIPTNVYFQRDLTRVYYDLKCIIISTFLGSEGKRSRFVEPA